MGGANRIPVCSRTSVLGITLLTMSVTPRWQAERRPFLTAPSMPSTRFPNTLTATLNFTHEVYRKNGRCLSPLSHLGSRLLKTGFEPADARGFRPSRPGNHYDARQRILMGTVDISGLDKAELLAA